MVSVRARAVRADANICSHPVAEAARVARRAPARADRAGDRGARGAHQRRLGTLARARRRVRPRSGWARHRLSLDLGVGRLALRAEPALGPRAGPRGAGAPRAAADPRPIRAGGAELLEGPGADPGRRRGDRGRPARARPPRDRRPARAHGARRAAGARAAEADCPGARELRPLALGRRRWLPAPATRSCRPRTGRSSCARSTRRARRSGERRDRRGARNRRRGRFRGTARCLRAERFRGTACRRSPRRRRAADQRRIADGDRRARARPAADRARRAASATR